MENTILALSKGTPPQGGIDMEPNSPENLLQNIVLENVSIFGNTQRGLTLSAHSLRSNDSFVPISIKVAHTNISGGSMGISITTSPKGVPAGSTLDFAGVIVRNTSGAGLLLEDKHVNLATTLTDSIFEHVATVSEHPMWIEGRNSPCDGAAFRNVTIVDDQKRTPVNFMADVEHMSGAIGVRSPQCAAETAPPGNTVLISCLEEAAGSLKTDDTVPPTPQWAVKGAPDKSRPLCGFETAAGVETTVVFRGTAEIGAYNMYLSPGNEHNDQSFNLPVF